MESVVLPEPSFPNRAMFLISFVWYTFMMISAFFRFNNIEIYVTFWSHDRKLGIVAEINNLFCDVWQLCYPAEAYLPLLKSDGSQEKFLTNPASTKFVPFPFSYQIADILIISPIWINQITNMNQSIHIGKLIRSQMWIN